jgi:hypothetical protein
MAKRKRAALTMAQPRRRDQRRVPPPPMVPVRRASRARRPGH